MSRQPYAATVFVEQITELRKSAKAEFSEPDGFDVLRTVTFDKATTKWLGDALDYIEDERIVGYSVNKEQLSVIFNHGPVADERDPFPIAEAVEVAEADSKS